MNRNFEDKLDESDYGLILKESFQSVYLVARKLLDKSKLMGKISLMKLLQLGGFIILKMVILHLGCHKLYFYIFRVIKACYY